MSPSVTEDETKAVLVESYLQKFALVENRILTPALLSVYFEALRKFSPRQVEKGLRSYLEEGERWPWPGTLAEYIEREV